MGTYNIPERFNLDFKQVPYREKYDFTELMHTLFLETENDKYYQDAKIVNDEAKEISYITMKIDSVEKNLYFKALESWKYGSYTPTKYLRDPLKKPEEVLVRCKECITNGGYSFDIAKAREVKPLSAFATGNVEFDVERPTKTLDPFAGPIPTPAADQIITDMISANPEVVQNTDGTIDVTFTLKDASNFKNIGVAKDRTPVTPNDQDVYMRYMTRGYFGMNYTDVTLDGNKFTVKYADANEAAWGKNIKFAVDLGEINPSDNNPVDTIFLFDLKVFAKADAKPEPKPETVKFENNGWSFELAKADVAEKTVFEAKDVKDGVAYDYVQKELNNTHSANFVYAPAFTVDGKAAAFKANATVTVTVPSSWEKANINFYTTDGKALNEITDFNLADGKLTFNATDVNNTYVLAHKLVEGSIKGLADGVYTADVKLWQIAKPSELSMADDAVKPGSVFIEVKDGNYNMYLGLQGIKVGDIFGYTYQLRYKDNESKKQIAEPLGWITKEGSVYNIDSYAAENNIIYPSYVKVPMASNNITRNRYEIIFNVAVMDELMGEKPGSGSDNASRSTLLKFYDITKVDVAAPSYEPTYLLKALEDAEKVINSDKADFYEKETFDALKVKAEEGRVIYEEMLKAADGNKIKTTADGIYEALDAIVYVPENLLVENISLNNYFYKVKDGVFRGAYNGNQMKAVPVVKNAKGEVLKAGVDYEVSYSKDKRVAVGAYKFTVKGIGNYKGEVTSKLIITPKAVSNVKVRLGAYAGGYDDAYVTWNKSKDADGYYVYMRRPNVKNNAWVSLGTVKGNTLLKKDLADGYKYQFKVLPYVQDDLKYRTTGNFKAADVQTLMRAKINTAKKYNNERTRITWTNVRGVTGYKVMVSAKGNTRYFTINSPVANVKVVKNAKTTFKVRAYKDVKNTSGKTIRVYAPWSDARTFTLR